MTTNTSSLWPYIEAQKIIERTKDKDKVIFETGYGPSGPPHIGTFGEVARTSWVRNAYETLTGKKTKLIAFSDDMDALRKTPDNIPNKNLIDNAHGFSLSKVPNPFDTHDKSFAHHNNRMLCEFIDEFGFEYEFASSTEYYTSGRFNNALTRMAECHEEICKVVRPTLRGQRSDEWSPFMPLHPLTGKVMTVPIIKVDSVNGNITWIDTNGDELTTSILNGNCKIGWRADWALRWYALGVDYEMSGKDLIDSVKLSSRICKILGGTPPINLTYELFLDEDGKKISKSIGNGISIEEWLEIASPEALELYMFNNPTRAKKISKEIAIQTEEDYIKHSNNIFEGKDNNSPVGEFIVPQYYNIPITYSLIINIISAASITDSNDVWEYLLKYDSTIIRTPYLEELVEKGITYYSKYIAPNKKFRILSEDEQKAVCKLLEIYENLTEENHNYEQYQYWAFEVGKEYNMNLREWFKILYEFLLGQSNGPRFGNFVEVYGLENTINLIKKQLG